MTSTSCHTTGAGLSACLAAARALAPKGSIVAVASTAYYETAVRLSREGESLGWTVVAFEPDQPETLAKCLECAPPGVPRVVWVDQPSNWWLDAYDLTAIATVTNSHGGRLVVDTTVHPLSPAFRQGADVVVQSLSKYPSQGQTTGGVVLTRDPHLSQRIADQVAHLACALSSESAHVIHQQMESFLDRFAAVSQKAADLARFARQLPGVLGVRYPDPALLGTVHGGGMFVLELESPEHGERAELIIEQNQERKDFPLNFKCSFGMGTTNFECFRPRGSANDRVVGSLIRPLPNNFCRVGVGGEPYASIRDALALAFT